MKDETSRKAARPGHCKLMFSIEYLTKLKRRYMNTDTERSETQ